MITRVEIENFKAIEKLSMDFTSRLTVIVGPNGSGKTSILQAIDSFDKVAVNGHVKSFRRLGSANGPWIMLVTPLGSVLFDPDNSDNKSRTQFNDGLKRSDFPSAIFLRSDFDRMSQPSLEGSWLYSDASNLSAVLASLKLNNPEKFDKIESTLGTIIPQIARIRIDQVPMLDLKVISTKPAGRRAQVASGFQLLLDTPQAKGIPADSASEGTLLTLAIVTAIVTHEDEFEHIMLIDDLDASLHPAAQERLIAAIRKLLVAQPALQIIATSHSPYLLHSLEFDEVRLTTLRDDGTVACGKLTDHPDFDRWKDEMTPGEMWGMFGEKWLAESPQAEATA